jgi:hypothetical protein
VISQPSDTPASTPTGPAETQARSAPVEEPAGTQEKTARQLTDPLRQPAAFVLLAANGLILLFAITDLFVIMEDWPANFLARAGGSFVDFVGIVSIGFPLLAVLLATHVKPRVRQARLVTVVALVEYGVSALFGALCLLVDFLHSVTNSELTFGIGPTRRAFEDFLVRAGEFAVLAIAAFAVFQLFQGLYSSTPPIAAHPPFAGPPPAYAQPGYPVGFHPYDQQAPGFGGPPGGWGGWGGQSTPGAHPESGSHSEPGPAAGDQAQPTQGVAPPEDPEGPAEQWRRP